MAANPTFAATPNVGIGGILTTGNTAKDGTGTSQLVFTAGSSGAQVMFVKARSIGTNVQTVLRVFLNNGGTPSTATNNVPFTEQTIAATTISETAAQVDNIVPIEVAVPNGWRVYCTIGTTVSAGIHVSGYGKDL